MKTRPAIRDTVGFATTQDPQEATITATAEAHAPIPSDVAWLHLVLVEQEAIVSDAMERSADRVSIVLDRIRETEPRLPETVLEVERKIEPIFDDEAEIPDECAAPLLHVRAHARVVYTRTG